MRQKIILAVANGCCTTREIAKYINSPLSSVNNYFYESSFNVSRPFENGDVLQWTPGKARTIRLADGVLVERHKGVAVAVYRAVEGRRG